MAVFAGLLVGGEKPDSIKNKKDEASLTRAMARAQAAELHYRQILDNPAVTDAFNEFKNANLALQDLYNRLRKKYGQDDECVPSLILDQSQDSLYIWDCKPLTPAKKTDSKPDQKGKE